MTEAGTKVRIENGWHHINEADNVISLFRDGEPVGRVSERPDGKGYIGEFRNASGRHIFSFRCEMFAAIAVQRESRHSVKDDFPDWEEWETAISAQEVQLSTSEQAVWDHFIEGMRTLQ